MRTVPVPLNFSNRVPIVPANEAVEKSLFEFAEVPIATVFGVAAPFLSLTPTSGVYNGPEAVLRVVRRTAS